MRPVTLSSDTVPESGTSSGAVLEDMISLFLSKQPLAVSSLMLSCPTRGHTPLVTITAKAWVP